MIPVRQPLTKENIFKKITSYDIFKTYCENFKEVGRKFKSDLRQDDKNPSCCIAQINGDLLYTDFGKGSYRALDYMREKFSISFMDVLVKLNEDFNLGLGTLYVPGKIPYCKAKVSRRHTFNEKKETVIRIKQRKFTLEDLAYWGQYSWTEEMLVAAKIKSLSNFWLSNEKNHNTRFAIPKKKLCYSYEYYWNKNIYRRKLYLPETDIRFISNVDNTIVQGYHLLPKAGGEILFVTSSYKDCGVFWNCGFHAIAPNTETSFVPLAYLQKLMNRWRRIIIWFDNDWHKEKNEGVANAKKYGELYGLEHYYNPDHAPKDPSDYVKQNGGKIHSFKTLLHDKVQGLPDGLPESFITQNPLTG